MRTRRKSHKVKDEAMPESVAPKVSAAPAVKQDWGPTAVQRDNRDAILDRARDYKGKNPTADGGPQALAGLGSSGLVKMADKMVKNVTSPNKPQPSAPTSVYDPKNSLGVAEKLPTVDQSNYEAARLRAQTEAMRANTAQQTLQTSLIQSRGAETPFNALGLQQQGINPQAAQGAGVNVDYTGYVQNYPVPQAIQQANAVYGQHLAGAPIMPPPPVNNNPPAPTLTKELANSYSSVPPDMEKAKRLQQERQAVGAQRRQDSQQARLRGTSPEIEANRRAMQEEADKQRQQELDAVRQEARVSAIESTIQSNREQRKEAVDMHNALARSLASAEGPAVGNIRTDMKNLADQIKVIDEQLAKQAESLILARVPTMDWQDMFLINNDPEKLDKFKKSHKNLTPAEWLEREYNLPPGTAKKKLQ